MLKSKRALAALALSALCLVNGMSAAMANQDHFKSTMSFEMPIDSEQDVSEYASKIKLKLKDRYGVKTVNLKNERLAPRTHEADYQALLIDLDSALMRQETGYQRSTDVNGEALHQRVDKFKDLITKTVECVEAGKGPAPKRYDISCKGKPARALLGSLKHAIDRGYVDEETGNDSSLIYFFSVKRGFASQNKDGELYNIKKKYGTLGGNPLLDSIGIREISCADDLTNYNCQVIFTAVEVSSDLGPVAPGYVPKESTQSEE